MQLIAALQPRTRFFLFLVPRAIVGRCTPIRLVRYAISLTEAGNSHLARWCWKWAIRRSTQYPEMHAAVLDICIRSGHQDSAAVYAKGFYDGSGFAQFEAVRLIGDLAVTGAFDAALSIYDRLLEDCSGDIMSRSPAPPLPDSLDAQELRSMLAGCAQDELAGPADRARLALQLARMCFSFAAFETSARLFDLLGEQAKLGPLDRIARAYALLRADRRTCIREEVETLAHAAASAGADWQIILATVLFACGAEEAAASTVETALRATFSDHADIDRMAEDCRAVVGLLGTCPALIKFDDETSEDPSAGDLTGVRKLFVCGSGWSGSGAVYDALMEYDGLAEAPCTPLDQYMNVDTDNEMMFVQGPAGLGYLWRTAREQREISRLELWDMFRLHVLGGGAIGYSEHKSAKVATNLRQYLGPHYTGAFRRAYEAVATLPRTATLSRFRGVLTDTAEALSAAIVESSTTAMSTSRGVADCVVFNNAIFGPNIDMLEIFRNARAAVVVRDPLDQYSDRRAQDVKHWMKPNRFIPLYRSSRESFAARAQQLPPALAQEVREVEFERFVLDAGYREGIIGWLLEGQTARRVHSRFEPKRSAKNIGIYANLLAPAEREMLTKELKRWRRG